MPLFPGRSKKERCAAIFQEIQVYYREEAVTDRLDTLLPTFFQKKQAGYKLRCSAAKARALVPFAWRIAHEILDEDNPVHASLKQAAFHLNKVYECLSSDHPDPTATMKVHGVKFALQYVALHDHLNPANDKAFRIKPKLHLFLHITGDGSIPRKYWTYRDEDFGGSVARMARRRGGLLRCGQTSAQVLRKFKVKNACVRIR